MPESRKKVADSGAGASRPPRPRVSAARKKAHERYQGYPNPALVSQLEWVIDAQASDGGSLNVWPPDWRERGRFDYLYADQQLLVQDEDLSRVADRLTVERERPEIQDPLFSGVTAVAVPSVADALTSIDSAQGRGVATPNHFITVTPLHMCPAKEPSAPGSALPWPPVGAAADGLDVRVAVVDTGFLQGWGERYSWLEGVKGFDVDDPDRVPRDGFIDPYAGHGTFIAGIIGAVAPAAEITVENVLQIGGVATEAAVVRQVEQALEKNPDIISLSAGGYTRGNVPSKAFAALWRHRLRDLGGVAIISAAGNDADRTPFWPAAFPWCVGVGALDVQGLRRAEFSNFGSWVDVYAPGEDFVNAFCDGYYLEVDPPHKVIEFKGAATWSGTSFSAPLVAALIATRMSRTGENARLAADRLLEVARGNFLPGVGPRLLP